MSGLSVSNFNIDNASGQTVRLDIEACFKALQGQSAEANDSTMTPQKCVKGMTFLNTQTNDLKIRNSNNDGFTVIGNIDQTNFGLLPRSGGTNAPMTGQFLADDSSSSSSPAISFATNENLGIFRSAANQIGFSVLGAQVMFVNSTGLTLSEQGTLKIQSNNSNTVGIKSPNGLSSSLTLTLPGSIVDGGFLKTDASGNLSFSAISSAASALTGSTLASGVTASSLTSVGTLTALTVSGDSKLTTIKDASGNNPSTPAQLAQGRAKAFAKIQTSSDPKTIASNSNFNISSVTDLATGRHGIAFATAFANNNYVALATSGHNNTSSNANSLCEIRDVQTTGFEVQVEGADEGLLDRDNLYVVVFSA